MVRGQPRESPTVKAAWDCHRPGFPGRHSVSISCHTDEICQVASRWHRRASCRLSLRSLGAHAVPLPRTCASSEHLRLLEQNAAGRVAAANHGPRVTETHAEARGHLPPQLSRPPRHTSLRLHTAE